MARHQAQETELLQQSLGWLSAEYREVLVLSRYQELKYGQIAHVLDITEGTVKVGVHGRSAISGKSTQNWKMTFDMDCNQSWEWPA